MYKVLIRKLKSARKLYARVRREGKYPETERATLRNIRAIKAQIVQSAK